MSSLQQLQLRPINDNTRYTQGQLVQLRRQMLRFARSTPLGTLRNERRQIARSLRSLFRNKQWLNAHTIDGSKSDRLGDGLFDSRLSNSHDAQ